MTKLRTTRESDLINVFARMIDAKKTDTSGIVVGVGDDTAVVRPPAGRDLLLTNDVQVEGRHFERSWLSGAELGWRLAAVNLSDIAAMGGKPLYGVMSLTLPLDLDIRFVKGIERGVRDHLARHGAAIVGGNVSGTDDAIVCELTLVGSCARGRAWRRRCRPGRDAVVVVGTLGDARAGLDICRTKTGTKRFGALLRSYRKPKPKLDVAAHLAASRMVSGAIDVSDGFATDLIRLCEGGGAGCEIDSRELPLSKSLHLYCNANGKVPIEWALHGGEDYALILSIDAGKADRVAAGITRSLRVPARVVGRFTRHKGRYVLLGEHGSRTPIRPGGWDHLTSRRSSNRTPSRRA